MSSKLDRLFERSARLGVEIESLRRQEKRAPGEAGAQLWQPRFELYHDQDHLFIDLELPGVPESAVEVVRHPDLVIVRGHKPPLEEPPDREPVVSTREYGAFSSEFAVPPGYVVNGMERRLENGVLHLRIRLIPRPAAPDAS